MAANRPVISSACFGSRISCGDDLTILGLLWNTGRVLAQIALLC